MLIYCPIWFHLICLKASFFAAEGILVKASIRGAFSFEYVTMFGYMPVGCQDMRKRMFEDGTIYIMFTCLTSETYHLAYWKAQHNV